MAKNGLLHRIWKRRTIYLFISPFYLLFLVFGLFPILWSLYLTFHEWNGLSDMQWIGLGNYSALLRDSTFLEALRNTAIYWVVDIFFIILLALILASLLHNAWLKGSKAMRVIIFLPYVTATVAVGLVFNMIFDFNSGLINSIFKSIGLAPQPWLNSVALSKIPVMVLNIWRVMPWYLLIIFSGLQAINPEYYEAATVDGANAVQKMLHITIPSLAPILFFCFLTETIESFRIFTEPFVMTGGGPGSSSLSIVLYLYRNGFQIFKMGYASTIAYALTFILLIISAAQIVLLRKQGSVLEESPQ
ncbi:MAG TPA: sugar ABC transporter permease [Anaerolineae bacterium]